MSQENTSLSFLDSLRSQQPGAWDRFDFLYRPLIQFWCRRWMIPEQDLDDVTQEITIAVLTHLPNYVRQSDSGSFRAWMRGIARNKLLDYSRRHRRDPQLFSDSIVEQLPDTTPAPVLEEPAEEVTSLYKRAADVVQSEFSTQTWQIFWKTTFDDRPSVEVAREYNVAPASVRMAKSRVLKRIREELGMVVV